MPLPPPLSRCALFLSAFLFSFLTLRDRLTASGVFFPPPSAASVVTVPFFLHFFVSLLLFSFSFLVPQDRSTTSGFFSPPPSAASAATVSVPGTLGAMPGKALRYKRTCQKMETYINGTKDSYRDLYRWDQRLL